MLEPNSTASLVPWLEADLRLAFFGAGVVVMAARPLPRTMSGRNRTRIISPSGLMVSDSLILS